jgi:PEP-CTERM motif
VSSAKLRFGVVCLAAYGISADTASATTITFNGLTGANGDPFTTYTESGFTLNPTLGAWFQGQLFGNRVPSIFSGPAFGSPTTDAITVTDGAEFTFGGLDLAANTGNVDYTFTGTLRGASVFNVTGTELGLFGPFAFVTIPSGVSAEQIDELVVTTNIQGTSTNIDNIVVTPLSAVPEPTTVGLLAIGLALLGLFGRRRCAAV